MCRTFLWSELEMGLWNYHQHSALASLWLTIHLIPAELRNAQSYFFHQGKSVKQPVSCGVFCPVRVCFSFSLCWCMLSMCLASIVKISVHAKKIAYRMLNLGVPFSSGRKALWIVSFIKRIIPCIALDQDPRYKIPKPRMKGCQKSRSSISQKAVMAQNFDILLLLEREDLLRLLWAIK